MFTVGEAVLQTLLASLNELHAIPLQEFTMASPVASQRFTDELDIQCAEGILQKKAGGGFKV